MLLRPLLQGHAAERRRAKVGAGPLDRQERAEELVPGLPPLGDQGAVGDFLPDEPVVLMIDIGDGDGDGEVLREFLLSK